MIQSLPELLSSIETLLKKYQGPFNSQLKQDILVLFLKNFKENGFFVEFGACDGKHLSNTFFLEKNYNWTGILAEPEKKYYEKIRENRSCFIDNRAVYNSSNTMIEFRAVLGIEEISGINGSLIPDSFRKDRDRRFELYEVETITLHDLLDFHNAPKHIDYLSVDTEGSEYEILSAFNFENYSIDIITVEHNYIEEKRQQINSYLESKDYIRIFQSLSEWDDWFIHKNFLKDFK